MQEVFEFLFQILFEGVLKLVLQIVFVLPGVVLIRLFLPNYDPREDPHGCLPIVFSLLFWLLVFFIGCLAYHLLT